jgi:hypothetical protein
MYSLTSTLEIHFKTLKEQNIIEEDGVLIGNNRNVLTYLPFTSGAIADANNTNNTLNNLEKVLAGGLHILGLYSFSTSAENHIARLQKITNTLPGTGPWLLVIHKANKLSHFEVKKHSKEKPSAARVQFQENIEEDYHQFSAQIPIIVRAPSSDKIKSVVHTMFDKRRAILSIDSVAIPRQCLSTLNVAQIPTSNDVLTKHNVTLQFVKSGMAASKSFDCNATSPTIVTNQVNSVSFVHRSSKLQTIVETLADHVARQCSIQVSNTTVVDLSMCIAQSIEKAQRAKYLTIPTVQYISNSSTAWASLQPALTALISNTTVKMEGKFENNRNNIGGTSSYSNNNTSTAVKTNPVSSTKIKKTPSPGDPITTSSNLSAVIILAIGIVLIAIAIKMSL